jgi:iduronate 2-sulfatase
MQFRLLRLIALPPLAAAFAATLAVAAPAARPNVLFLVFDDLRTTLGCYGDPVALTPNLDRLAARGAAFTRAYSQIAVCNPSRASVLTGRRPDALRVWDLRVHFRKNVPDVVTLPQHFKQHGYRCEAIGKIYHDPPAFRDEPSWSVPAQLDDTRAVRGKYVREDNLRIYQPGGKMGQEKAAATEAADVPDHAYIDGRVADLAVQRLRALATQPAPFFLAVGFRRPHLPFSAPRRYWDLYDPARLKTVSQPDPPRGAPALARHDSEELRGYTDMPPHGACPPEQTARLRHGYYAATSYADAQAGRVLAALRALALEENTVIVVWSDHGYHLGEHGLWAKATNYEADTRVPLLVAYPGQPHRGARSAALCELLDVYPTLVDLCGLPIPAGLDGRSLRPWLETPARPGRDAVFSQFSRPWPSRGPIEHMGYAVRTATHRYVEWRRFGTRELVARELYAYAGDELFERENLAADPAHAMRLARLAALLPAPPR